MKIAGCVLLLFALVAIAAPKIAPYDPRATPESETQKDLPPSLAHPFGTDEFSRDVLSRVVYGARVSLGVAAAAVALAMTLGAAVGAVAGYAGGWTDVVLMRAVDAMLSVPRVLLLLVLVATTGPLSVGGIILLLGFTGWPGTSRLIRGEVLQLKQRDYVLASRATGTREWKVFLTHVLPGALPQLLVSATLALATVIPLEAGLSFLGLGVQPPTASWGNIISDAADRPGDTWWVVLFPGLASVCTVLAVNTIGERLRTWADPRQTVVP
ncbi:MAG TPA: ABC transporter permease [Gemmatimonadaceae bacterium]|jgi:peptide/nickel transport system permease protein